MSKLISHQSLEAFTGFQQTFGQNLAFWSGIIVLYIEIDAQSKRKLYPTEVDSHCCGEFPKRHGVYSMNKTHWETTTARVTRSLLFPVTTRLDMCIGIALHYLSLAHVNLRLKYHTH
jgi:hypothetical protein